MAEAEVRFTGRDDTRAAFESVRRNATETFRALQGSALTAFGSVSSLGVALAAIGSTAAIGGIMRAISALDELEDRAQALGITSAKLSQFEFAAKFAGVDNIDQALNKFNATLADARGGGEKASIVVKALGINLEQLRAGTLSMDEALAQAANTIRSYRDDFDKANLVQEAFGSKQSKLIALLNQGAEGLTKFGGASQEQIDNAAKLSDEIDKLSARWNRLTLSIGGAAAALVNFALESAAGSEANSTDRVLARLEKRAASLRAQLALPQNDDFLKAMKIELREIEAQIKRIQDEGRAFLRRDKEAGSVSTPNVQAELEAQKAREAAAKKAAEEAKRLAKERAAEEEKLAKRRFDIEVADGLRRFEEFNAERARQKKSAEDLAKYTADYLEVVNQRAKAVIDAIRSEEQAEKDRFTGALYALIAAREEEQISEEEYRRTREALEQEHQQRLTEIQDAETRKRLGIAQVYRRMDLQATSAFLAQISVLMNTNSRAQFEVGKAAAIAGAMVDTYKAATGAYAALASIPFVGPALGAAAAAAAFAAGVANVQRIKATQFGATATAGGALAALPGAVTTPVTPAPIAAAAQEAPVRSHISVVLQGSRFSAEDVRELIEQINEQGGMGADIVVTRE